MLDPYKLVVVNSIIFSIFIFSCIVLRKKKFFVKFFLITSSLLPLFSLLRKGVHESGDFAINISKSMDLYNSLTYGIFPVHWASILNATYGYPLFLFTYPLPYYSIALFKFLGFSFITSEKIVIASAFILSGVGIYMLLRIFLKPANSLFGAILYLFAPYHLVDMHFRVALGELFAYAVLPFVFYFEISLIKKPTKAKFIFFIASLTTIILSHQAISLITLPFAVLLPIFLKKKSPTIYIGILLSLMISCFYFLPVIEGIKYTHQTTYSKFFSFENPILYIISPWRYGFLYQGPIGQLSFPIGFVQIAVLVVGFYLVLSEKVKKYKKNLIYLFAVLFFMLFLLTPYSLIFWQKIPFMTNFQFAYRLMLPISFITAIISAIITSKIKKTFLVYLLIFICIVTTMLNWGTRSTIPSIDDDNLWGRIPTATAEGEGLQPAAPKWRDINNIWIKTPPKNHIEIETGEGTISTISRTPVKHEYLATISKNSRILENTYYFPGWNLYINGEHKKINYLDISRSNLIRFTLTPGNYEITLKFEETKTVKIANLVSLLGILLTFIYFTFYDFSHKSR